MTPESGLSTDRSGTESRAMKTIPERERLESTRRRTGDLQGHLVRIRASCGEEDLCRPWSQRDKPFRQLGCDLVGKSAGRERQEVDLPLDRLDKTRMPVADVVHRVAVEIHVAAPGGVFDPDAFRPLDR